MDEKYRSKKGCLELFTSSNGVYIRSIVSPDIYKNPDYIYLRGAEKLSDEFVVTEEFDTNEEAQDFADKVRFALEEWNNHVEIIEIEYKRECINKGYVNSNYEVIMDGTVLITYELKGSGKSQVDCIHIANLSLSKENIINLFNYKCELLNIPFRLK